MSLGSWKINVQIGKMPEKVATAIAGLEMIGAEYEPIAYIGSQEVNGINHAVLAKQVLTYGKDSENVVLLIFNEKGKDIALVNIERVVEGSPNAGGTKISIATDIPDDAKKAFRSVLTDFIGAVMEPLVLLATQVTNGTNYVFATQVIPISSVPKARFAIVTVNPVSKKASFADVLGSDLEAALGKPLGEWP